ncbi:hypothetical protein LFLEISCH_11395 [Listeria fleischmannii subsp. fleischmannii LU2006-1]|nr:hypothetical protein LFLEISCH_11395 [Listeria fleischmannii subsp. fleischmannii LU2006-1]
MLIFYLLIIIVCAFVCIALESNKQGKRGLLFWLVFATGIFFFNSSWSNVFLKNRSRSFVEQGLNMLAFADNCRLFKKFMV